MTFHNIPSYSTRIRSSVKLCGMHHTQNLFFVMIQRSTLNLTGGRRPGNEAGLVSYIDDAIA